MTALLKFKKPKGKTAQSGPSEKMLQWQEHVVLLSAVQSKLWAEGLS